MSIVNLTKQLKTVYYFALSQISKLQQEIDQESETRSELSRLEREIRDPNQKAAYKMRIEKSDEKVQSLALLMLHYCAGLQHCMEEQELDRQKREANSMTDGGRANCAAANFVDPVTNKAINVLEKRNSADEGEDDEDAADDELSYDEGLVREDGLYQTGNTESAASITEPDGCNDIEASGKSGGPKHMDGEDDVSDSLRSQQLVMSFQALLSQQDSDSGEEYIEDNQDEGHGSDPEYDSEMHDSEALGTGNQTEAESKLKSSSLVIEQAGGVTNMVSEENVNKST